MLFPCPLACLIVPIRPALLLRELLCYVCLRACMRRATPSSTSGQASLLACLLVPRGQRGGRLGRSEFLLACLPACRYMPPWQRRRRACLLACLLAPVRQPLECAVAPPERGNGLSAKHTPGSCAELTREVWPLLDTAPNPRDAPGGVTRVVSGWRKRRLMRSSERTAAPVT